MVVVAEAIKEEGMEDGEDSRADVAVASKGAGEGGGAGSNRDPSPSSSTWGKSHPSSSYYRAVRIPFSLYVHPSCLPLHLSLSL